ncbi:MAG: hypothetical protein LUO93_02770 [Methanomicrobiales archaeon]|nr:hypothetical protein [Methanomicrobiales archaeon]
MEVLSRETAYTELHARLIGSYALDALFGNQVASGMPTMEQAQEFLRGITRCSGERYQSAGMGSPFPWGQGGGPCPGGRWGSGAPGLLPFLTEFRRRGMCGAPRQRPGADAVPEHTVREGPRQTSPICLSYLFGICWR